VLETVGSDEFFDRQYQQGFTHLPMDMRQRTAATIRPRGKTPHVGALLHAAALAAAAIPARPENCNSA
jgi:hypothetical protein